MSKSRLLLHPILVHKKSRKIFLSFLAVGLLLGILLRTYVLHVLREHGVDVRVWVHDNNVALKVLLSPFFYFAVVVFSSALAAGFTSHYIVGPIQRIEEWLRAYEAGHPVPPLVIRSDDKYMGVVQLINAVRTWAENRSRRQ